MLTKDTYLVCRNNFIKNYDDYCIGDSYRTVSELLQERYQDYYENSFRFYYENSFRFITRTVSDLLRERFQIIARTVSDLLREQFQILLREQFQIYYENSFRFIMRTVSDYRENGLKTWEQFVVTMQERFWYW